MTARPNQRWKGRQKGQARKRAAGSRVPEPRSARHELPAPRRGKERTARARVAGRRQARRVALWGGTGLAGVGLAAAVVASLVGGSPTGEQRREVPPPPVAAGAPDIQPAVLLVANRSGVKGVVAYDTTGWPPGSHNGPAAKALRHAHVPGTVAYSVTPPVGGDHSAIWLNCGVYDQPVSAERAVHDLEHGAVWITYRPSLPRAAVRELQAFEARQSFVGRTGTRYVDLTPYPGLPAPVVVSSWGYQLRLSSPNDPRLQAFVDAFRASPAHAPEPGGECTGGAGTPIQG